MTGQKLLTKNDRSNLVKKIRLAVAATRAPRGPSSSTCPGALVGPPKKNSLSSFSQLHHNQEMNQEVALALQPLMPVPPARTLPTQLQGTCKVLMCEKGASKHGFCDHHLHINGDRKLLNVAEPGATANWVDWTRTARRTVATKAAPWSGWGPAYCARTGYAIPIKPPSKQAASPSRQEAPSDFEGFDELDDFETIATVIAATTPPGSPIIPVVHRSAQQATQDLRLDALPQTQAALGPDLVGCNDKTSDNQALQCQLLIRTMESCVDHTELTAKDILGLNVGAALIFKRAEEATNDDHVRAFNMYFHFLSQRDDVCIYDGRALCSHKTKGNYSFSVKVTNLHAEYAQQQRERVLAAHTKFLVVGDEQPPETIAADCMTTVDSYSEFGKWVELNQLTLNGVMDSFMVILVIGSQESGKSSFEAARYFLSSRFRVHRTLLVIPKLHRKFANIEGFDVNKLTYEESEKFCKDQQALSNFKLGSVGDCQLLLAAKEHLHTHFAQWHHVDTDGLRKYVTVLQSADLDPPVFKLEEPDSEGQFTFVENTKRWSQTTNREITKEPKEFIKSYKTMPYVKEVLKDGLRDDVKGFELTLHKLQDLVCSDDSGITGMSELRGKLNWVFVVFECKGESLYTHPGTGQEPGLIQELAEQWPPMYRDRLQWYCDVYCEKHDVLAIEVYKAEFKDMFPDKIESPWKRFTLIKAAAYYEHVYKCGKHVETAAEGELAKLYSEKTIQGVFKCT